MFFKKFILLWFFKVYFFCKSNVTGNNLFGGSGPFEKVDEVEGYPEMKAFFKLNVENKKPLKMLGAAIKSPAFSLWSDAYLINKIGLEIENVIVEENKKEDRKKPILKMTFGDFLRMYNDSNHYLVNHLPVPLLRDIHLPSPLQCPQIYKHLLLQNVMWMSSGDTHSVVHKDNVENIICVIRGSKRFIIVDPLKYSQYVHMDHPDEGYSDIDVINVNYKKYSGLLNVKYHEVNLTSGDCLYVPYEWIHQVTSMGSNIAVNVWWQHSNPPLDLSHCPHHPHTTLADVVFKGLDSTTALDFRSDFLNLLKSQMGKVNLQRFYSIFLAEGESLKDFSEAEFKFLKDMFVMCDTNANGTVEEDEVTNLSKLEWESLEGSYRLFEKEDTSENDNRHPIDDRYESNDFSRMNKHHETNNHHSPGNPVTTNNPHSTFKQEL